MTAARQWDDSSPSTYAPWASEGPVQFADEEPLFRSPGQIVAWWLNTGRPAMGGLKAIDYGAVSSGQRDHEKLQALHHKYSMVVRCVADLADDETQLLIALFRDGRSCQSVANKEDVSERTISRRCAHILRKVRVRAVAEGLLPSDRSARRWHAALARPTAPR